MQGNRRRILPRVLVAGALTLYAAVPTPAATVAHHVRAQLVSEVESIHAGEPFSLGLHLKMEPGWHTYWKNPGDSGLPTRIKWTLPDGFEAGPIEWPYPKPFSQGSVTSYGYEHDVLLPVRVTPPASLAVGQRVTLAARADWLECREQCLPGRADLTVTLPAAADAPRPAAAWAGAFAAARRRQPKTPAGWTFEAADDGSGLELHLRPPKTWGAVREAYFFSEEAQVVDHAAPQKLARGKDGYRLDLVAAPNVARPLAQLHGVLVTSDAAGAARAVRVVAPVASKTGGLRPPPKEEQR